MQGVSCFCVPLGFVLLGGSRGTPVLRRAHMGWDALLVASGTGTWPLPPTLTPLASGRRKKKQAPTGSVFGKCQDLLDRPMFKLTVSSKCTRSRAPTRACVPAVCPPASVCPVRAQARCSQPATRGRGQQEVAPAWPQLQTPPRCHRSCVGRRGGEGSPAQCARKGAGHVRGAPSGTLVPVLCTGLQAVEERARGCKWERRQ